MQSPAIHNRGAARLWKREVRLKVAKTAVRLVVGYRFRSASFGLADAGPILARALHRWLDRLAVRRFGNSLGMV